MPFLGEKLLCRPALRSRSFYLVCVRVGIDKKGLVVNEADDVTGG